MQKLTFIKNTSVYNKDINIYKNKDIYYFISNHPKLYFCFQSQTENEGIDRCKRALRFYKRFSE